MTTKHGEVDSNSGRLVLRSTGNGGAEAEEEDLRAQLAPLLRALQRERIEQLAAEIRGAGNGGEAAPGRSPETSKARLEALVDAVLNAYQEAAAAAGEGSGVGAPSGADIRSRLVFSRSGRVAPR